MNYALIENGVVTNIIYLHTNNVSDFPNAIPIEHVPATINDIYKDGIFYRDGKRVKTNVELMEDSINAMEVEMSELDAALLEIAYENIIGGLE